MIDFNDAKKLHDALFDAEEYQRCRQMWLRIQDKQLPFLGELDQRDKFVKKDRGIIDMTAWRANMIFSGGMANGSVPQTVEWFDYDVGTDDQIAKEIAESRRDTVNLALNHSNFYSAVHYAYQELPFGQSPVGVFFDPTMGIVFENYSVGSYAYALDQFRNVMSFAVKKKFTYRQLAQKFGLEKCPDRIKTALKDKRSTESAVTVYWLVTLNPDLKHNAFGPDGKRYLSLYWVEGEDDYISTGGFDIMPIAIAPYCVVPNCNYGIGPGWFADSDTAMMHAQLRNAFGNMELFSRPPVQAPSGIEVDFRPGTVTELNGVDMGKVESLFNIAPVFQAIFETAQATQDNINAAYNVNLFAMLEQAKFDGQGRTAFELDLRQQEKMQQLSPIVTRINHEFLGRLIEVVYSYYERQGGFEQVPPEYEGMEIDVKYVSPLAQVQKMSGLQAYEYLLNGLMQVAQLKPEIAGILDAETFIREYAGKTGAPTKLLYDKQEYQELLAQQAEAAEQEKQMAQVTTAAPAVRDFADAAANVSEMATDGSNPAVDQILNSLQQV